MSDRATNLTISLPSSLLDSIEASATRCELSRAEWIRRACIVALAHATATAPKDAVELTAEQLQAVPQEGAAIAVTGAAQAKPSSLIAGQRAPLQHDVEVRRGAWPLDANARVIAVTGSAEKPTFFSADDLFASVGLEPEER